MPDGVGDASYRSSIQLEPVVSHDERIRFEEMEPAVSGGNYRVKRALGEVVSISVDILFDGHDLIAAEALYRRVGSGEWRSVELNHIGNDRWTASVILQERGLWEYTVHAWFDPLATLCKEATAKLNAGQLIDIEIETARQIFASLRNTSETSVSDALIERLSAAITPADKLAAIDTPEVHALHRRDGPRPFYAMQEPARQLIVERKLSAFGAWYELMPRSQSGDANRHGTFQDVIGRLDYIRDLGFDILYLTPIHPIGTSHRKGRNNSLTAGASDPGSPYAIGNSDGGHDAIHSELGSLDDFKTLVAEAASRGLEIALDFAVQCSPDHPWITSHPDWFERRPDGTIRYAENPPKKYEDIVNVAFYGPAYPSVWLALRDVVLFWVSAGVKIFRVDNPHTKPFPFWQWLIAEVQRVEPDVIFLSEAFTRPKIMHALAKLGFTQSYSYFTWRNTKAELTEYMTELTSAPSVDYMRPNFFANTPDINPFFLQTSGRPGFRTRFALASTLAGNYGIYSGFEICEADALPGKEEYANSEKYEIRAWDWDRAGHIRDDIRLINRLRRQSPALQCFRSLKFYNAWNESILYYGKATADLTDFLLFAVNLDPLSAQSCHFELPLWEFGLDDDASIAAHDLITDTAFVWTGKIQHMTLDPLVNPFGIWRLSAMRGNS